MLDKSKLCPEVLKLIEQMEKLQLKAAFEYIKKKENRGFNLQEYMEKIAEFNDKFLKSVASKKLEINDFYGIFNDEELHILAKFYRFAVDYSAEIRAKQQPIPDDIEIKNVDARGVPAEWQIVPGADEDKVLLYFHGGGFILMSPQTHRALTTRIAQLTKMRVLSIDYRLAPEYPFPAALEDCIVAYKWLLSEGYKSENIIIGGDSAGGNLTLTCLIKLRDEGVELPAGAIMLSPATEFTNESTTMYKNAPTDPILADVGLFWWMPSFLAGADPKNPLISPLYADLTGLPPILIQVSTTEMLYDHSTRFAKRAKAAGVDLTLQEWKDMIHVFQSFGLYDLPEAEEALEKIREFIQNLF